MRSKALQAAIAAALTLTVLPDVAAAAEVERVVVLMRHGIRPQTNISEIKDIAKADWQKWPVADGMLTPHGAAFATRLGQWERGWLGQRKLFQASACPTAKDVFVWSSRALARTTDTGRAFIDGMFPGCAVPVGKAPGSSADPLFTASETDVGPVEAERGTKAILDAMGGSIAAGLAKLKPSHDAMQKVLDCCRVDLCQKAVGRPECTLSDLPTKIHPSPDGRRLLIEGPISLAATAAQVLLLQYAEGMAPDQVGWGKAGTLADVIRLSEARTLKYEFYEQVPYIARRGSSNILAQLTKALTAGTGIDDTLPVAGPPEAAYTLFVGSDTQISQIGTILGVHWKPATYRPDETPPTGGLIFERVVDGNGQRSVRLSFVTPTLDQMRGTAALDETHPPEILPIPLPECATTSDGACPVRDFAALIAKQIDRTAIADQSYR